MAPTSGAVRQGARYWRCDFVRELGRHLREGRCGARLLAEVLINQRTQQIPIARHARRRSVAQHQLALKFDQPSKLLRAGQKMTREPCERLVGEQLDQFRHEQAGGLAVEDVHQDDGGGAFRVSQGEVHRGGAARVVTDRDDLVQPECCDDGLHVAELLWEAVLGALRLVGGTEPEEVDRDRPAPGRHQVRDQIVVDVRVVGEAVQQQERRPVAPEIADVDISAITWESDAR
jgi:hypothetical protein